MSFPSVLLFKLRIEIPLWRDHVTARRPPADLPAEESETDADDHGVDGAVTQICATCARGGRRAAGNRD